MSARLAVLGTGANADLLIAVHNHMRAHALLAIGAVQSNLGCINSTFSVHNTAGLAFSAGLKELVNDMNALDNDLTLLGGSCDDFALDAGIITGQDDNGIAFLNMQIIHVRHLLKSLQEPEKGS